MATFIVRPIARDVADQVRITRRAPNYGHPVHEELAMGTGPCRECLRAFDVGTETRLLFTYSPFDADAGLPQPGPIFIHAEECRRHEGAGYPHGLQDIPVVAQLYYGDGTIGEPKSLPIAGEDAFLSTLFEDERVRFAHLRHAQAGCFIARAERVPSSDQTRTAV
jgi:hypothetical protein